MGARRPDGAALLVAGHGAPGGASLDASAVHTLGQIGEALLATGEPWQIRRLTAAAGERYAADRATLKRHLDELITDDYRALVVVLLGAIVEVDGAPALITGNQAREYPEDATLPLSWIGDRISASRAEHVVVAVSARGDGSPERWLGALGTRRSQHLIAVDAPAAGHPMIDSVLTGLCGDAVDPRTGTVTMASLSDHVARHVPLATLQTSISSETLAQPPPLAGLWDVRRSQLAQRAARPRPGDEPEDLTGIVLPGRFRIDKVLARGTFGTVYRARQLAVERDVAIKVLHADIDPSSEDGRLFVQEIRSVGRIDHANVVRIHQADMTHDGRLFFAMDLLDGRDLQQVGAEGVLPRGRAVALVRQLLAGLGAAHDADLVHADVKPANAIVVARGQRSPSGSERTEPGAGERVVLVDFGLARLRTGGPAESAGGTPAYMAPEQLHEGRVDARSDLFSAALVLVFLLTGWRRPNAIALVPPLDKIEDPELRAVLARALDRDPARRYQSARALSAALIGSTATPSPTLAPAIAVPPFHHLAALTETDRGRLHGRAADLAVLTEHVLYRRSVIYTAPSGTGKTSILRAGLLPRLEALGVRVVYLRCRGEPGAALAAAIAPGAASIADAIAGSHHQRGRKLVLVLDQLEASIADAELLPAVLAFDRWAAGADVTVVLSVREDYLARLIERTQELEPGIPIVRLPPLSPEGARDAIVIPLSEKRLAIEPELLDVLLADLEHAAAAIGPEMGWGAARAVFPPHLQLACSVLYEALPAGAATLTLAHYRRLGGFDAIVGDYLERVLENELPGGRVAIARDLFLALVTAHHQRAMRPEAELVAIVGDRHGAGEVIAVLEVLRSRGLLVRVRGDGGEPGWELVHDSLIARVRAWIDRRDLARRHAAELLRYHLRRSSPDAPALLGRAELRDIAGHDGLVAELDAEWHKRTAEDAGAWTPSALIARSRSVLRREAAVVASVVTVALAVALIAVVQWYLAREAKRHADSLLLRDLGRAMFSFEWFDWDAEAQRAIAVPARIVTGDLAWALHKPDPRDVHQPGEPFDAGWLERGPTTRGDTVGAYIEAHGGPAFLVIERTACPDSKLTIPIQHLPGYAERRPVPAVLAIRVPTCQVTTADTIEIPAGPFLLGGVGEPPSTMLTDYPAFAVEHQRDEPGFRIDRTEVSNAAFGVFTAMARITGIADPAYSGSPNVKGIADPRSPVTGIDRRAARAFCRFLGKQLPTTAQWTKAMRGGLRLADGSPNPMPRRNLPWGISLEPMHARIKTATVNEVAHVGTTRGDVSPYGVLDLAGNVTEWTASNGDRREIAIVRGGNWDETRSPVELLDFIALDNPRPETFTRNSTGMRCVAR